MKSETKKEGHNRCNINSRLSILSKIFGFWIFLIIRKRVQKKCNLTFDDVPSGVIDSFESQVLGDNLESAWRNEYSKSLVKNRKPSLFKVLVKLFGLKYVLLSLINAVTEITCRIGQIFLLKWLMESFYNNLSEPTTDIININIYRYLYVGGVCLFSFLYSVIYQVYLLHVTYMGIRLRIGISSLIYRKTLRLKHGNSSQNIEGTGLNILSNEVGRLDQALFDISYIIVGPITLIILAYALWVEIGVSGFSGICCILLTLPIQSVIGSLSKRYYTEMSKNVDKRSTLMTQIITGFKIIKFYGWELPFLQQIQNLRSEESKSIWKTKLIIGSIVATSFIISKLTVGITLLTYFLMGNKLSGTKVFFVFTAFNMLQQTVSVYFPIGLSTGAGALAVVKKVQDYLILEEKNQVSGLSEPTKHEHCNPEIQIENLCISYEGSSNLVLDNLNVNVNGNKLVMIIGAVGAGKSTFLHSIMNEVSIQSGTIHSVGKVFYVSQVPWIFSGTIKQNILLGLPENELKLSNAIFSCGLAEDLEEMKLGLDYQVGPKGAALSGGQKARVSLARALYQSRSGNIILLDDPLASVDVKVGKHIFKQVVLEYFKSSLRILVTHQLQYLEHADYIVALEKGKSIFQGTYDKLLKSGIDISKIVENNTNSQIETNQDLKVARYSKIVPKLNMRNETEAKLKMLLTDQHNKPKKIKGTEFTKKRKPSNIYWTYYTLGNSKFCILSLCMICLLAQLSYNFFDIWITEWSGDLNSKHFSDKIYEFVLIGTLGVIGILMMLRQPWLYRASYHTGLALHEQMFCGIIRAPTRFYDSNDSGEIMNRFTKDLGEVDNLLPSYLAHTIQYAGILVGVVLTVITSNYYLAGPSVVFIVMIIVVRHFFATSSAELKILEAEKKGPMYTHFSDTCNGLLTIRVFKSEEIFHNQFDSLQNNHSSACVAYSAINRCFGLWIEVISSVFLAFVSAILFGLVQNTNATGHEVWIGLAICSILTLTGSVQFGIRMSTEAENTMKAFKRCLEYTKIKPEAPLFDYKLNPPKEWPTNGTIRFHNVSLSYHEKTEVLHNLNFEIQHKERIGIVGRTGAGKSSLISALFRMTEPTGKIIIDEIDISQIGLNALRTKMSIIPQDPVLFSGSIRYNLDPFGQYDDGELWRAIKQVELSDKILSLDDFVAESGGNFSVGEKQLICLARTILTKNKILILDEATANVDIRTETMIQNALQTKFPNTTIISIAHRLSTVMNCDRILVLDHGKILELDSPENLLSNPSSSFFRMIN